MFYQLEIFLFDRYNKYYVFEKILLKLHKRMLNIYNSGGKHKLDVSTNITLYLLIRIDKHFHDGCGAFVNNIRIGYGRTDAVAVGSRSLICRICRCRSRSLSPARQRFLILHALCAFPATKSIKIVACSIIKLRRNYEHFKTCATYFYAP